MWLCSEGIAAVQGRLEARLLNGKDGEVCGCVYSWWEGVCGCVRVEEVCVFVCLFVLHKASYRPLWVWYAFLMRTWSTRESTSFRALHRTMCLTGLSSVMCIRRNTAFRTCHWTLGNLVTDLNLIRISHTFLRRELPLLELPLDLEESSAGFEFDVHFSCVPQARSHDRLLGVNVGKNKTSTALADDFVKGIEVCSGMENVLCCVRKMLHYNCICAV